MATISRTYRTYDQAARIVAELEAAGVPSDDVSIFANNADGAYAGNATGGRTMEQVGAEAAEGATTGAGVGATLGGAAGLLTGIGLLAVPGVGAVAAAGWLATVIAGAAVGGAAGGMVGALIDAGIPDEDANYYAESLRRGDTLVVARASDTLSDHVQRIMDRDSIDLERTRDAWRNEGWSNFDPARPDVTAEEMRRYRHPPII